MKNIYKQRGFMQVVVLAIVAIAALAYFNVDLRTLFQHPLIQKVWHVVVVAWLGYVKPILLYLWATTAQLFN